MTMSTIAIIQFPGSNCEYETKRAVALAGGRVSLVSWTTPAAALASYASYILPGGFSFQDRIRAGVVAAKLPVMTVIKEQAALGKPVLGICNGCQMLAEAGLVLGLDTAETLTVALAPNRKEGHLHGFVCDWVTVKIKHPKSSLFTRLFTEETVLPIPINHAEGRMIFANPQEAAQCGHTQLVYCDHEGQVNPSYPTNPNGSYLNMAGIANKKGNVFAMMPHPERAVQSTHIPRYLHHPLASERRRGVLDTGPWLPLFRSLVDYVKTQEKTHAV